MKFQTFVRCALGLAASLLLASCGGGGAANNPNQGGTFELRPAEGTFYAGVPATVTISGGRKPYSITSSEPSILSVPPLVDGFSFDVVPNNPGVIDAGLPPGSLPIRTVTLTARDTTQASLAVATIHVAQNFLTGYGLIFTQTTCAQGTVATTVTPCSGGDTTVQFSATFNGSLHGNEPYRLDVVRGNFAFYDPLSSTNTTTPSFTTQSDHEGKVTAVIRVPAGTPSQVAILRLTHIPTGVSVLEVFTITATVPTPLTLTAIPASFTFTGTDSTQCGLGSGDFFVFDGVPPYSAVSSNSAVLVSPTTTGSQPGRFTVTVASTQACPDAAPVIVTDSQGNRAVVTVTSNRGPTATPPPALTVAPSSITLTCGTSGSVSVVGGTGSYSVNSTHPRVNATVSGNTVTITRVTGDGATVYPTAASVSVTDGSTIQPVSVTVPANCP